MKNQKGITLVALVVTIVVLLILAGVTISMTTGRNSVLDRSVQAKEETKVGTASDALTVTLSTIKTNIFANKIEKEQKITEGDITETFLKDELSKQMSDYTINEVAKGYTDEEENTIENGFTIKFEDSKNQYIAYANDQLVVQDFYINNK